MASATPSSASASGSASGSASASASASDQSGGLGSGGGRRKPLGFVGNAMKRKDAFVQLFLMTGILLLSMRSLGQKYRIHDLALDNSLLRDERDTLALRTRAVRESLRAEADADPSGVLAAHLRRLFRED